MGLRLRLVLVALLTAMTWLVAAGPAAAEDPPTAIFDRGLDLALITQVNQARAAVGAPPLSATHSVDIYAYYSATGDWACGGQSNPDGPDTVAYFGIDPGLYTERVSAAPASPVDDEAILRTLLQDGSLLDPALKYAGVISVSGGAQCPNTLRTSMVATDDVAWFGQLVSMVSLANGKFVTAEAGGAQPLIANRDSVGEWELFDLMDLSATDVSLRSLANGRFVTAEAGGALPLIANRSSVGQWETFAVVPTANGAAALFSRADNRWVTAEAGGSQSLIANRTTIGQWEQFELRGPDGAAASASDTARTADTSAAAKVAAAAKAMEGR